MLKRAIPLLFSLISLVGCFKAAEGPGEVALVPPTAQPQPIGVTPANPPEEPAVDAPSAAELATRNKIEAAEGDPLQGKFFLVDATRGLRGKGALEATIRTSEGDLSCTLFADKAPVTVANFIGLARGLRPFKEIGGAWVTRPAYDGTTFHRIIPGFMVQGGDTRGNGSGEPGYVIPDELWDGAKHDRAGLLCMANRGPNTNGAQFFITDASTPHLDRGYTIFGECSPVAVVHAIANVPTNGEKPQREISIARIEISRAP